MLQKWGTKYYWFYKFHNSYNKKFPAYIKETIEEGLIPKIKKL